MNPGDGVSSLLGKYQVGPLLGAILVVIFAFGKLLTLLLLTDPLTLAQGEVDLRVTRHSAPP